VNLSRLMILGLLTEQGPMHGHQIRRTGELTNAEIWGGITGGAIYAELRRLDGEGLVQPVREEQVGRRPARTIYGITDEGRLELVIQRKAALETLFPYPDPVSVVLLFAAGADLDLRERLRARRNKLEAQIAAMSVERNRLTQKGVLPPMARAAFRRSELRFEAELRWHEEFEEQIGVTASQRPTAVRPLRARRGGDNSPRDTQGSGA
jgi:DNA-binding PadR family transcriptional regulator